MTYRTFSIFNRQQAWKHFWPEGNGKAKPGFVLHHKDPNWATNDPQRYAEWRIEDLQMLSLSEHRKLHNSLREWSKEMREKCSIASAKSSKFKGHNHSEKTRRQMSNSLKGVNTWIKGRHHWNNGITEKLSIECPGDGWNLGRLKQTI